MKRVLLVLVFIIVASLALVGCANDANVASQNLSIQADMFKINRRIVFYNGITGEYILQIEGFCSLGNADSPGELSVTCKVGDAEYKKHFLGLSDNVTYFAEQINGEGVSVSQYKVIFKPSVIIPDIEIH